MKKSSKENLHPLLEKTFKAVQLLGKSLAGVGQEVSGLKKDITGLKSDVSALRSDTSRIETDTSEIRDRLHKTRTVLEEKIDATRRSAREQIESAQLGLNRHMRTLDQRLGKIRDELAFTQKALKATKEELIDTVAGGRDEIVSALDDVRTTERTVADDVVSVQLKLHDLQERLTVEMLEAKIDIKNSKEELSATIASNATNLSQKIDSLGERFDNHEERIAALETVTPPLEPPHEV